MNETTAASKPRPIRPFSHLPRREPRSPRARHRRHVAVALALAWAVVAGLLLDARPALAEWDVQRFVALRDEAQKLYDAERYDDALPRYLMLRSMIADALEANEIPEAQQPLAREALEVVRYQAGRCLQLTGECSDAVESYEELRQTASSAEVQAKARARLSESMLCWAQATLSNDLPRAVGLLDKTQAALNEAPVGWEGLSPDTVAMVDEVVSATQSALTAARDAAFGQIVVAVASALDVERCTEARGLGDLAVQVANPNQKAALDDVLNAIEERCRPKQIAQVPTPQPEPVADDTGTAWPPVGAIVLMGAGAAVLIGDAVYEGVVVSSKIDDFDSADRRCRSTGLGCGEVLTLRDDVDTAQILTIALLGVGAVSLAGGITWWVLDATGDGSGEAPDAAVFFVPVDDGMVLGLRGTLP